MKKLILLISLLLLGLNVVYSAGGGFDTSDNNVRAYYKLEDITDATGRTGNLTNNGATAGVTGIIDDSFDFVDVENDYMEVPAQLDSNEGFVSLWINPDLGTAYQSVAGDNTASGEYMALRIFNSGTGLLFQINDGVNRNVQPVVPTFQNEQWYHIVATWGSNGMFLYLNGTEVGNLTSFTGTWNANSNWRIGTGSQGGAADFDGMIDEFSYGNMSLNSSQVAYLYNAGAPEVEQQYPFVSVTPQINLNISANQSFNYNPINVNMNTSRDVNISIYINGVLNQTLLNTDQEVATITLAEGDNNLSFQASDFAGISWNNISVSLDTTDPVITNNIPSIGDSFTLNVTNTTCTDNAISSCLLAIDSQTIDLLSLNSVSLTNSGNLSYSINATDLAGNNVIENGNIFVKPFATLLFEDPSSNPITDFTLDGTSYNLSAQLRYYDELSIGNNNLTFQKNGFAITNISLNLNSTAPAFNQTFTIQNSKIVLKVFDYTTGNLISDSIDLTLLETNFTTSFSGGEINISDISFYNGEYQVILESANYETESVYFTYTNTEVLAVNAYMIPTNETNLGVLNVKAETTTSVVAGQLVNLLAWDSASSSFITVGQAKTNSNGDAFFNVLLGNVVYKVTSTRGEEVVTSPEQIIKLSGTIIVLNFGDSLEQLPSDNFGGVLFTLTNTTQNLTHDLITFTFNDPNNLVTQACLDINRLKGSYSTLLNQNCVGSASGEIQIITSTNNTFVKEVVGKIFINNEFRDLDSIIYESSLSFENSVGNLAKWLALVLILSVMALGIYLENINIFSIGTIVASWVSYSIFPTNISYTIPLLITIVMILIIYGTFKRRF